MTALKRLNVPLVRYPGGNFVSGYRWMDGIGPKEDRPTRVDMAWNDIDSNHFGTNEFIDFCRKINTEPYMVVNCGDGDMREARDWVEYCNGTKNTALAKLRRQHGYEAPHNVKYWGIGNEVDGHWQIGYKTPNEYARAYLEYAKVMKWIDPANTVKMANIAQLVNAIAPIFTSKTGLVLQTIFYPFELYSKTCGGTALDVFWKGETFSGGAYTDVRVLDVSASLDEETNRVTVYVVNRSKTEHMETTITLAQGCFGELVQAYVVNGPDVKSENTFATPDEVGMSEVKGDTEKKSAFTYNFEPHSVTALIFAL